MEACPSAASPLLRTISMDDVPQSILDEIRKYCLVNPEEECCGVVFSYEDYRFFPLPNENASSISFRLPYSAF